MIRLSLLTEPVEVDFSEVYPDVKIILRRLRSDELAEAREEAVSILRKAREGLEALGPYGLNEADAHGRRLNPLDPAQMTRAGTLVGAVEIARRAIQAWTGVSWEVFRRADGTTVPRAEVEIVQPPGEPLYARHRETGERLEATVEPAPVTRETLSILLQDGGFQQRLMREVELAAMILVQEGKGFGPSPVGSSATRPVTAGEPPSAGTAGSSGKRARAAAPGPAAVPVSRRRKRPKP